MKKTFLILLSIFIIIVLILVFAIHTSEKRKALVDDYNKTYTVYENREIMGTELISLINKAIDDNEKNNVEKQENTIYYENNNKNSIQITVQFLNAEKGKEDELSEEIIPMENIARQTSESFMQFYSTAKFKCTKIEYHENTNFVKSLAFEQVNEQVKLE